MVMIDALIVGRKVFRGTHPVTAALSGGGILCCMWARIWS